MQVPFFPSVISFIKSLKHFDRINTKVLVAILLTSLGMCLVIGFILNVVFSKSFSDLGKSVHLENKKRLELLMEHELNTFTAAKFSDWAAWDDTYDYMHNHNKSYEESNLSTESLSILPVNFITYWDQNSKIISGFYQDKSQKAVYEQVLRENKNELFSKNPSKVKTFYIKTPKGAAYVATMPIFKSDGVTGPYGRMVVGREIDSNLIKLLSSLSNLSIEYHFPNQPVAGSKNAIPDDLKENEVFVGENFLESEVHIKNPKNKHILSIDILEKRVIHQHAKNQITIFYIVFLSVAAIAALIKTALIRKWIVNNIKRLSSQVELVKNGEAQSIDCPAGEYYDEIGILSKNVHDMVEKLHEDEEELIRSKLQAEAVSEAKTQFLANMSHEIRTPLHSLMGSIDLVETTELNAEQKQYLEIARISGVNLMEILGDILDFSKIEAGRIDLSHTPFDLNEMINEVSTIVKPQLLEKELGFKLNNNNQLSQSVVGDKIRLKQVVINMLTNAKKYTQEGMVSLNVETQVLDNNAEIKISITDTGMGIPEEKLPYVFERFMQVDQSSKKTYSGVGLGLSICKSLVEMMDGQLGVESQVGKGSTFWIKLSLPIFNEEHEENFISIHTVQPNLSPQQSNTTENLETRYKGFKILVVDDQSMNRTIMKKYLEKLHCNFELAESGQQAFEMHKKSGFDLILMDIQMPEMDGIQAMRLIRWKSKKTPLIIALTANNSAKDIQMYLDAGFDDFAGKPIGLKEISAVLDKWGDQLDTVSKINALGGSIEPEEELDDIQKLIKKAKAERQS